MTLPFTLQGPLLRYSEFASQTEQVEEHLPAFNFKLLALGTVQIALGLSSYPLTELLLRQHALWASLLVGLGTAPWGFYFAAAGVFHLMEALAQPWGITLPKSFDRPFGRSNLSAFWSSWNLTVTNFFRDALFYQRWGLRKPSVYLNLLLLFIAVGLWHGSNFYWICWGALHGLGFIIYVLHRSGKIRIFKAVDNKASRFANVALTYLFVCGCWYIPNKLVILATPLALLLRH